MPSRTCYSAVVLATVVVMILSLAAAMVVAGTAVHAQSPSVEVDWDAIEAVPRQGSTRPSSRSRDRRTVAGPPSQLHVPPVLPIREPEAPTVRPPPPPRSTDTAVSRPPFVRVPSKKPPVPTKADVAEVEVVVLDDPGARPGTGDTPADTAAVTTLTPPGGAGVPPPPALRPSPEPAPPPTDPKATFPPGTDGSDRLAMTDPDAGPGGSATAPGAVEEVARPLVGATEQLTFAVDDTVLTDAGRGQLDRLVARLDEEPSLRLQIKAFASGDGRSASQARRVSLSRALAVRAHLLETGVESSRIDVRALGSKVPDDPKNRVDVLVIER